MASAIQAGFRLEEHYTTRDTVLPELAAWAGLEPPVLVPGVRQTGTIAQANQAAVDATVLQTLQALIARVGELEAQVAKSKAR